MGRSGPKAMTVRRGSRYEYAVVDYLPVGYRNDKFPVLFYYMDNIGTIAYSEYVWNDGDRLDLLALDNYGSSDLWWVILEHNPEIEDPHNIPAGYTLRVPRA